MATPGGSVRAGGSAPAGRLTTRGALPAEDTTAGVLAVKGNSATALAARWSAPMGGSTSAPHAAVAMSPVGAPQSFLLPVASATMPAGAMIRAGAMATASGSTHAPFRTRRLLLAALLVTGVMSRWRAPAGETPTAGEMQARAGVPPPAGAMQAPVGVPSPAGAMPEPVGALPAGGATPPVVREPPVAGAMSGAGVTPVTGVGDDGTGCGWAAGGRWAHPHIGRDIGRERGGGEGVCPVVGPPYCDARAHRSRPNRRGDVMDGSR